MEKQPSMILILIFLNLKKKIKKSDLECGVDYINGFHIVLKKGIEHLLLLLYQTSKKIEVKSDKHEVNLAQIDVENTFEEN